MASTTNAKKGYQFIPHAMKDETGKRVQMGNKAKAAAKFLAEHIWGGNEQSEETEKQEQELLRSKIIAEQVDIDDEPIRLKGLACVIKKFRRRKSVGPNAICHTPYLSSSSKKWSQNICDKS